MTCCGCDLVTCYDFFDVIAQEDGDETCYCMQYFSCPLNEKCDCNIYLSDAKFCNVCGHVVSGGKRKE